MLIKEYLNKLEIALEGLNVAVDSLKKIKIEDKENNLILNDRIIYYYEIVNKQHRLFSQIKNSISTNILSKEVVRLPENIASKINKINELCFMLQDDIKDLYYFEFKGITNKNRFFDA